MLRHASLKLIACCLALSACVTINVYFPAAAAEKAADKIIEDVWGSDEILKINPLGTMKMHARNIQIFMVTNGCEKGRVLVECRGLK